MTAYRIARGVRLQRTPEGEPVLLVPEGIVALNETAADTLELVDGTRDASAIATLLSERYEFDPSEVARDIDSLLQDFVDLGYVIK